MLGAMLSATVTMDRQLDVLPLLSVTVNVTVLGPTFEQVNVLGDTVID